MYEKLLRLHEVEAMTALKKTKIYELIREDSFPPPVRLGTRNVRWKAGDVATWIASLPRVTQPDGGEK